MNFSEFLAFRSVKPCHQGGAFRIRRQEKIKNGHIDIANFLLNKDNPVSSRKKDRSGFCLKLAFQNPEQSRFSAAIGSDQTDLLAIGNMCRRMLQKNFGTNAHRYVVNVYHNGAFIT